MIKEFCFGIWAAFWVAIDNFANFIGEMSLKEFSKFIWKVVVYGFYVLGLLMIILAMGLLL